MPAMTPPTMAPVSLEPPPPPPPPPPLSGAGAGRLMPPCCDATSRRPLTSMPVGNISKILN